MIETFRESKRITQAEYCPTRQVPLNLEEILLQEVKREDEINHAGGPKPEIPKYNEVKIKHPQWVKHFIKGTLGQLMP